MPSLPCRPLVQNVWKYFPVPYCGEGVFPNFQRRKTSSPFQTARRDEAEKGSARSNLSGDPRVDTERGPRGSGGPILSRMVLPYLYGTEILGWPPNCYRFVSTEQVPRRSEVPDDEVFGGDRCPVTGAVGSFDRLKGRLFPSTHSPQGAEVFPDRLAGESLSVPSSPVRSEPGPLAIHGTSPAPGGVGTGKRRPNVRLSGRLANSRRHKIRVSSGCRYGSGAGRQARLQNKYRKVRTGAEPGVRFSGYGIRPYSRRSSSHRRSDSKNPRSDHRTPRPGTVISSDMAKSSGSSQLILQHDHARKVERQTCSEVPSIGLAPSLRESRESHSVPLGSGGQNSVPVVARSHSPSGRCFSPTLGDPSEFIHRRQPLRLGGTPRFPHGERGMDTAGEAFPHKHLRDVGGGEIPVSVSKFPNWVPRSPLDGQRDSSSVPEERGRHALLPSVRGSHQDLALVSTPQNNVDSIASGGKTQCPGGRFVKGGQGHSDGVVPEASFSVQGQGDRRHASPRPVRHQEEQESSHVCVAVSGPSGLGGGRAVLQMGRAPCLRISAVPADKRGPRKSGEFRQLPDRSSGSEVVFAEVVPQVASALGGPSTRDSDQSRRSVATRIPVAPDPGVAISARVAAVEQSLASRGFSQQTAGFLRKSTRESSAILYDSKWQCFADWCRERSKDPLATTVQSLADFLMWLFSVKSLSVSAIKGYRSALAHTWRSAALQDPSTDTIIAKLIKSFEIQRPPVRQVAPPWNLSVVLNYLMGPPFEPLSASSWRNLTFKTVFLIAFATAARRSELHAMSAEDGHVAVSDNGKRLTLRLAVGFLAKNQAPGEVRDPYSIRALSHRVQRDLPDVTLCPVRAFKYYWARSQPIRRGRKRLFISLQENSSKEISRETISRWLVTLIKEAHSRAIVDQDLRKISGVKGHQVRAMATSWSAFSGASIDSIKKAAFWKGQSTFSSFYLRDLSSQVGQISALCPLVAAQSVAQGDQTPFHREPDF